MRVEVGIHEAKTNLSKLVRAAEAGDEVIVVRDHLPVVQLVPVATERAWGQYEGAIQIPDDFDAPLDDEFYRNFEAPSVFPDRTTP